MGTSYRVRVDSGDWVSIGSSTNYTFSGLTLGKHVLTAQAVSGSGNVTGSSSLSVDVRVWVPTATDAVVSCVTTVGIIGAVSIVANAITNPITLASNMFLKKFNELIPKYVKDWLEGFVASKRSTSIVKMEGPLFTLTRLEILAYGVAIIVLTLAFGYCGAGTLEEFLLLIPSFLITGLAVGLIKNYIMELFSRNRGIWAEYRVWYFGLATFILSTLLFKTPFSSPSRTLHSKGNSSPKHSGITATASLGLTLVFAAAFFLVMRLGFYELGSIGLAGSLLSALFETIPVPQTNGKSIWDWSKRVWVVSFLVSALIYVSWLIYV